MSAGARIAAFVALSAMACGLSPPDEATGRRTGDGIAPWEDLGPVRLCLGNERISPQGSPVGGFCIDQNSGVESACSEDSDCGSREMCVCRRCTIQYCTSNSECGVGRACNFAEHRCGRSCHADSECPGANEVCSAGVCKGLCGADTDCQYAEVCGSQGRCIAAACGDDDACQDTEICRVQRQPRLTTQPTILAEEDAIEPTYSMWLQMTDDDGFNAVWRATSDDGVSFQFDPAQPVLGDRSQEALAPTVIGRRGAYRMYYEAQGGIWAADSPDGTAFAEPSLVVTGDYHAPGAVALSSGQTYVFLQVGERDGIAVWEDRADPDARGPDVLLSPADVSDPDLWRGVAKLGSPFVLLEDNVQGDTLARVWFDAFGQESGDSIQFGEVVPIPPNDSIGYASAPLAELMSLRRYPYNPVFDRVVAFLEHRSELAPAVVRVPGEPAGRYLLYYEGSSAEGTAHDGIGVARNPPKP